MQAPRLALVLKGYPRISETFIINEIRLLEQMGFRLAIISMRPPRELIRHAVVDEIKAPVYYLPEHFFRNLHIFLYHAACFALRRPQKWCAAFAYMLSRIPGSTSKIACVKHLFQAAVLAQTFLKTERIAHVHAHFAHSPTSVAQYVSMLTGLPFSFTAHAKDIYTQKPDRLRDKLERAAFVVTCTRHNKSALEVVAPQVKVHCVYHGIELSRFTAPPRPATIEPPYQILTVARFVEKKGLLTVLQALSRMKSQGLAFHYTLVGDGPQKAELVREIARLGLEDVVEMPGTLAHDAVVQLYQQAHCFVLGCKIARDGDRDGIPNVIAEAMAMGVPVAATRVSGIPELALHDETALLCDSNNPAALAESMTRLLTDAELRGRLIPAARQRVRRVFDNLVCIHELSGIYAKAGNVRNKPEVAASKPASSRSASAQAPQSSPRKPANASSA
ncbi:glycosyltransferase [Megalodesulfovibrio paquesii]